MKYMYIKRLLYKLLGKTPDTMPMVRYWRTGDSVQAKVMTIDGVSYMQMEGEDHLFPGFPRGHILFGKLSKLKHEIKNQIFNWTWEQLENCRQEWAVVEELKQIVFPRVFEMLKDHKYDMVPPEAMVPAVREIHRAWTKAVPGRLSSQLRDAFCYIIQEDDGYRFRIQFAVQYFSKWRNPLKCFEKAMDMLEIAEVIGDMKERERLWKRTFMLMLKNKGIRNAFLRFYKECDWNKVVLSEADKYFFRGKYFKVDLDKFEY